MKKYLVWVLSVLFTAILISVLVYNLNWEMIKRLFKEYNSVYLIYGIILYFIASIMRTYRLLFIMPGLQLTFYQLWSIQSIHYWYNHLLPASTGEISFPILLKKYASANYSKGIATLAYIRFCDLFVLLIFLVISLLVGLDFRDEFTSLYNSVFIVSIIGIIIIFSIVGLSHRFLHVSFFHKERRWKVISKIRNVFIEFSTISASKTKWKILWYSFLSNLLVILTLYSLSLGFNIEISFFNILFANAIMIPVVILPIKGIAGFGTFEGVWALSFWLMGFEKEIGVSVGFGLHIFSLIYIFIFAFIAVLILKLRK